MDITFRMAEGTFNYRVAAVILHEGKLLVMKDTESPFWYLPGGRVQLHETAEQAIARELEEELSIQPSVERPLWFVQTFFNEVVKHEDYHELGMYFLVDAKNTDLLRRGEEFCSYEETQTNIFRWVPLEEVPQLYLHPCFLKQEIFRMPEHLQVLTQYQ